MRKLSYFLPLLLLALAWQPSSGAEILWFTDVLDEDTDVSAVGDVLEAFAFTGDRETNAIDGTFPLDESFMVNGTEFTPLNFTQGDAPEFLEGLTYDNGEYGHTFEEEGHQALIAGLGFESGIGEQFMELNSLQVGTDYLVEFYYHHLNVARTVTFDDGNGNAIIVNDGPSTPDLGVGGLATGYFTADSTSQEIISTANTGSQYLSGYQLRANPGEFPEAPEPPEPPVALPPQLVGYWNFDGDADDSSGNGNHGVINGGVAFDADVPAALGNGQSAEFDGVAGTHVEVTHNKALPLTAHPEFTISMWVRGDGTFDNADDRIFSEGRDDNDNPLFNLGTQVGGEDGRVDFFYRNGSSPGHVFSDGEAFDDEWHHVLWVDSDQIGTLYIDGEEDATFDYSDHPEFVATKTAFGAVLRGGDCCNFTGSIDDVSMFNFALSDAEIAELAAGGSPLLLAPSALPGDFDGNSILDAADIDLLQQAILAGSTDASFDVDGVAGLTVDDYSFWATQLKNTWIGDSNLDGQFDSGDFVTVFTAGKFETGEAATWGQGDWNADGLFNTGDFVAAFSGGGFEMGAREAIASVPEPTSVSMLSLFACVAIGAFRRRK